MGNSKDDDDDFIPDTEQEARSFGFHALKVDNDLFNDTAYVAHKVINIKRVDLPDEGEDWEIWEDGQLALSLKGTRFNQLEKKFLRTVDGMKLLVSEYKLGTKTVTKVKEKIKKFI